MMLLLVLAHICPAKSQPARPLIFAFSQLEPWKTGADGNYGGAYTEIVRELAKRTGLQVEIQECPLKRCLLRLQEGKADIIIGVHASPQRQEYIHFLKTSYRKHSSDKVFYVQKDKMTPIREYADLASLRIGIKNGAEYFTRFDQDLTLNKNSVTNPVNNFRKLLLGRLDTLIIAEDQGEALLSSLGIRAQIAKAQYRVPNPDFPAAGIAKNSPHAQRLPEFEAAMRNMVADGTLKELYKKHYFDAYQVPPGSVLID